MYCRFKRRFENMDLVQIFVIWSVLVCHALCVQDGEERLKDGEKIEPPNYREFPFERPTVDWNKFNWYSTYKPPIRDSSNHDSVGVTLKIVLVAVVVLFIILKFLCDNPCREEESREELTNVTVHPPSRTNYLPSPGNLGGSVNPTFQPHSGTSTSSASSTADMPPSYSELVTEDLSKLRIDREKESPDVQEIPETPPPHYGLIKSLKF